MARSVNAPKSNGRRVPGGQTAGMGIAAILAVVTCGGTVGSGCAVCRTLANAKPRRKRPCRSRRRI
jgi:hypothetical protein